MSQRFERDMVQALPLLRRQARFLTRSPWEAEDLVQDALVRALRFRDSFRPGTNLPAWLQRILKNEFLTQRRRERRGLEDANGRSPDEIACNPNQEWRIRVGEMQDALYRLPHANRRALMLVAAAGLSYQQAAQMCGCEANVLKSRVRRARVKLAELTGAEASPSEAARRPEATP